MKKTLKKMMMLIMTAVLISTAAPAGVSARTYYNPNKVVKKVPKKIRKTFIKNGGKIYKVSKLPGSFVGYCEGIPVMEDYSDPSSFKVRGEIKIKKKSAGVFYHEFGHYVDYVIGSMVSPDGVNYYLKPYSQNAAFKKVYKAEKKKYKPAIKNTNRAYVTSTSTEYFAQTLADYWTHPKSLKKCCPKTFKALKKALKKFKYD